MKKGMRIMLMIFCLGVCQTAFGLDKALAGVSLSLPDLPWAIEVDAPGFVIDEKELNQSGNASRLYATNKETGVLLSVFLEPAAMKGDAKIARDHYWNRGKNSPFKKEKIKLYESGSKALVEYVFPEHRGKQINQKHINAYLSEDGYWIDVHVSQMNHREGSNDPLQQVIKTIRINRSYIPDALDYFAYGNWNYRKKNYRKAIAHYEKALGLEKQKRTLGRKEWIVLVDQLGMSYGISGDLDKSKQLFEWAVTREPDYPMFYYNLACAHAEMNRCEDALRNLSVAFKVKHTMLPGERMPDAMKDSSLRRCLENRQFRTEVERMKF